MNRRSGQLWVVVLSCVGLLGCSAGSGGDTPGLGAAGEAGATAGAAAGASAGTGVLNPIGSAGMAPGGGTGAPAGTDGAAGVGPAGSGAGAGAGAAGAAGTMDGSAGDGGMAGMGGDTPDGGGDDPGFARLPKVTSTDGPGSFSGVTKLRSTPPGGWLIYPNDLGMGGMKHPIFLFGPGGGTTPSTYETSGMHWDRYASYGFVIYVLPRSTGDGAAMRAGLDWVISENDNASSPLYQKLDTSKVCASGHSQGSVTTFDFMPDDRVTTTIHISGGSFDRMGPSKLRNATMFMCAPEGDVAKPQCDSDFEVSTVPTFYTIVRGADHLTSARLGWPATIAWLLWHLAGHDEWRDEFLEEGGTFRTGIYQSQLKNW